LFLDVQMPGLDGFGVLQTIAPEQWPVTIFVTAYEQHALRAFEVHALDYLLKPFDQTRFQTALQRPRQGLPPAWGITIARFQNLAKLGLHAFGYGGLIARAKAGWQWRAVASRQQTGGSTCTSSPPEAFAE
ncbi:response regulator, partial [Lacticaseibacillus rhamnosus]